jgi:neutral trehalase
MTRAIGLWIVFFAIGWDVGFARQIEEGCSAVLVRQRNNLDPAELYGQLFVQVQTSGLFADSKYFVDMEPRFSPAEIMRRYQKQTPNSIAQLGQFVSTNFSPPESPDLSRFKGFNGLSVDQYIKN